ncbi:hypothetical protein [Baaleninema sp.]|uniref:hypothetical protein n=1 Tax=Baaleninema sp. TaxID=3101197 RepID=UPI003D08F501
MLKKRVGLGIIGFLSLVSLSSLTTSAVAQDSQGNTITHGCGTGCRVNATRISDVETIRLSDGSTVNTALFQTEQIRDYGTPSQYVAYTQTPRFFADCSRRRVGSNLGEDFVPNPDWWMQLRGDDSDYATVNAGRGYYFDELCPQTR